MRAIITAGDSFNRASLVRSVSLGSGVFLFALIGILTRPELDLAAFWPANAFMLGMLVRFPQLATPLSWLCGAAGFFLADWLTGSDMLINLVLNGGNLLAIATGYVLFSLLPAQDKRLRRPLSVFYFLGVVLGASAMAGLIGAVADPILLNGSVGHGFIFWSITEMVNLTAFLPMLLTFPRAEKLSATSLRTQIRQIDVMQIAPLVALFGSALAGIMVGGPGAVAFPVPALLWCALTYSVFTTACLAFFFGAWTLLALRLGVLTTGADFDSRTILISARVGVTLIALGPLVVASVMAARDELLERLRYIADHDAMTGLQNRRAFFEAGDTTLKSLLNDDRPMAAMMLDIDHFKHINDRYGHAAGDRILIAFADILSRNMRPGDMAGRVGGEEFAVLLPGCTSEEASLVAARINELLRTTRITLEDGAEITATVSIGMHIDSAERDLERLLSCADKALYKAKAAGRNRYEIYSGRQNAESAPA